MIYIHHYEIKDKTKSEAKSLLIDNLSHYLNKSRDNISIKYNGNGKPYVDGIYFSVTHSKNMLIHAFCFENEIGVDIEFKNPKRNYLKLAQRYFHPQESNYLLSLKFNKTCSFFYKLWTAKEAYCKYKGGRLWHFLNNNFLNENNEIIKVFNKTHLMQYDGIPDYAFSLITNEYTSPINHIHE